MVVVVFTGVTRCPDVVAERDVPGEDAAGGAAAHAAPTRTAAR